MTSRIIRAWLALTGVVSLLALLVPMTASADPGSAVVQSRQLDEKYDSVKDPAHPVIHKATVSVSQTTGLVHQKVKVSWSGLIPTTAGGPGGSAYPVVVMQCWGTETEITQQTCWSAGSNVGTKLDYSAYDSRPLDKKIFGENPDADTTYAPFKAKDDGLLYNGEGTGGWPPGTVVPHNPPALSPATQNAVMPVAYQGFTNPDGTGETDFEMLTGFELPHLGCGSTAACTLVVVPIGDPTCVPDFSWVCEIADANILRDSHTWVSPTNWSRRFAFPLSFRESPATCQFDNRQETGFAGSYYLYQVLNNSWRPKFCKDQKLFRLGYTALSDGDARNQFSASLVGPWQDGSTNALLTSRPLTGDPPKPVVYAPVAVTGVAVSFVLDDENGKEVTKVNLNARLLAKMITQSYRTMGAAGTSNPGIRGNPDWWGEDREFLALNPGLAGAMFRVGREGANYPVISLGDLDAIYALTSYIAADKDAVAWLNGADDGYGTVVNPKFHQYPVPVGQLELRDDFKDNNRNSPVFGQILLSAYANVADNPYNAAVADAQAWPYAGLRQSCVDPSKPETCTLKRVDTRQNGGQRALLAITTMGDSRVFGLRQAALATSGGKFVAPDDYSIALALRGTKLDQKTGILGTDFPKLHPLAYPGMSIVYAAVPTIGLSPATAGDYAKFLDYAAGPGQVQGTELGQLPDGYVPLSDPLREQTSNAARAVRDQKGEIPAPPPGLATDPAAGLLPPASDGGTNGNAAGGNQPPGAAPAAAPPPGSATSAAPNVQKLATSAATRTDTSDWAKWALPGVLGLGVLAGLVALGATVWTQPQHAIRRALRAVFRRS
ncbi:hypothetical protein [Actinocrispum wychmicini]|uniref:PBP domain-containing protein n=1 Tax=Actinocrispum wychmicini TaxID=1213861 RepID=A0A4R2JMV0_9PSEU|nr:hypothetical protein [Actinocrispum wychmicini]TCO58438.1 hypothetical protein EV192_105507 [Actinocrispum wychmicini]